MTPEALERVVGWAQLHQAAARGQVERARALLDAGHDMNAAAADGFTPLLVAVHLRRPDVVTLLRERGAEIGTTFSVATTRVAAMTGDPATVRALFAPAAPRLDDEDAALFFVGCHERRGHRVVPLADGYEHDGPFDNSWVDPACGITGPLQLDDEERAIVQPRANSAFTRIGGISFRRVAPKARAKRARSVEVLLGRWRDDVYAVDIARMFLDGVKHPPERLEILLAHAARRGQIEVLEALEPLVADRARAVIAAAEGDQVDVLERWADLLHLRHPETKRLSLGAAAAAGAP